MRLRFAFLIVVSAALSGCGMVGDMFSSKVDCLSEEGQATAISIVKEQVEKEIRQVEEEGNPLPKSKIRAALEQIRFLLEDVRTSKEDPNSTKKFCTGVLKVTFPAEILSDAEKTRELLGAEGLRELAEERDFERDADAFRMDMDFDVQPTDDGKKVFSEIEDGNGIYDFIAQIVTGHLYHKRIVQVQAEEKQRAEDEQKAEEAALNEQKQASYEEAKATNDLAEQSINAAWAALPQAARQQVLPMQRAWIKRKDADCKIEAAGVSTDPTERETARLTCQARMNNERAGQIQNLSERVGYNYSEETY